MSSRLFIDLLSRGCVFQRYLSSSRVSSDFIWVDFDDNRIYFDREGSQRKSKGASSLVEDIATISTQSDEYPIFEENVHAALANEKQVLIIECSPPSHTLYLQAPSEIVRNQWAAAIQAWADGELEEELMGVAGGDGADGGVDDFDVAMGYAPTNKANNDQLNSYNDNYSDNYSDNNHNSGSSNNNNNSSLIVDVTQDSYRPATVSDERKYNNMMATPMMATPSPGAPIPSHQQHHHHHHAHTQQPYSQSHSHSHPPPSQSQRLHDPYQSSNNMNQQHNNHNQQSYHSNGMITEEASDEEVEHAQMISVAQIQRSTTPLEAMFAPGPSSQASMPTGPTKSSTSSSASSKPPVTASAQPPMKPAPAPVSREAPSSSPTRSSHKSGPRSSPENTAVPFPQAARPPPVSYFARPFPPEQRAQARRDAIALAMDTIFMNVEEEINYREMYLQSDDMRRHIDELEREVDDLRNALAVAPAPAEKGKIEIRIGTLNLEHEPPHQYVALLYVKHPLEEEFEYSQTCSLARSPDQSTYVPKLTLTPEDLFAFRQADEDEEDGDERAKSAENELVGAHLKIEIWDLLNKQLYGDCEGIDEHGNLIANGYQGHVEVDMNELLASKHHVLSLPIVNLITSQKARQFDQQHVRLVLHYCQPFVEEDPSASAAYPPDPTRAKQVSTALLASASSDPLLTLRLASLEEELTKTKQDYTALREEHAFFREQAEQYHEERKARVALEQRLVQEQIVRVKQEQEVMRLKPRAMELVDTSDELQQCKKKLKEQEFTITTLQRELRKATLPPTPHAMLDELLSITQPSLTDLIRVKKFILDQERVRCMLVEEMARSQKQYITYETTHDELIRRENALNTHIHWLEDEKRKLTAHNSELTHSLQTLQQETLQLSRRCADAEQSKELMQVNLTYLTEQQKIHKKKIDELERALLVHHSQMTGFEVAHLPVPQQVERQYGIDKAADDELDAQLARAQWELDHPQPDEPEEASPNEAPQTEVGPNGEIIQQSSPSVSPTPRYDVNGQPIPPKPSHSRSGSLSSNPPPSAAEMIAAASMKPRRTKIVYSDSLEQSLAAAGSNWGKKR